MKKRIIDAHLDLAWNALSWDRDQTQPVSALRDREKRMRQEGRGKAAVSLPEMRRGGVGICFATVLARARRDFCPREGHRRTDLDHATQEIAYGVAQGQLAYYRALERRGELRMIRTAAELERHWKKWRRSADTSRLPIGCILSMEGADPIADPSQAEAWWADGLRVTSLAHYGQGAYAAGTGGKGGLTPAGRDLLKEFERLGMILDLTHLSDEAFDAALDHFHGAVLASHNNCRALTPGGRQFSDEQIHRLIQRNAVIGAVMDAWMLHPGWERGKTSREVIGLEAVVDHMDHVCQIAGNARHIAIGSDLDGGFGAEQCPRDLETIADLQKLAGLLRNRGYSPNDVSAVFHGNWLRFLRANLPE